MRRATRTNGSHLMIGHSWPRSATGPLSLPAAMLARIAAALVVSLAFSSVLRAQGETQCPSFPNSRLEVGDSPFSVTSADFNGDGAADLAVANYAADTLSVLLGQGRGRFAPQVQYIVGDAPYAVTSADLDGDGDADLAVANRFSGTVSVLLNHGDGTFES